MAKHPPINKQVATRQPDALVDGMHVTRPATTPLMILDDRPVARVFADECERVTRGLRKAIESYDFVLGVVSTSGSIRLVDGSSREVFGYVVHFTKKPFASRGLHGLDAMLATAEHLRINTLVHKAGFNFMRGVLHPKNEHLMISFYMTYERRGPAALNLTDEKYARCPNTP